MIHLCRAMQEEWVIMKCSDKTCLLERRDWQTCSSSLAMRTTWMVWSGKKIWYQRDSPMAQMVKNLPAMQVTQVWFLGWEDPLRRKWLPTPIFLPRESHGQRRLASYSPWSRTESDMTEWLTHTHTHMILEDEPPRLKGVQYATREEWKTY